MKQRMKIEAPTVTPPQIINRYPTYDRPPSLTTVGVTNENNRVKSQLMTVPILKPFSCIISAIYSHVTGPDEAWKTVTNPITRSSGMTLLPVD